MAQALDLFLQQGEPRGVGFAEPVVAGEYPPPPGDLGLGTGPGETVTAGCVAGGSDGGGSEGGAAAEQPPRVNATARATTLRHMVRA